MQIGRELISLGGKQKKTRTLPSTDHDPQSCPLLARPRGHAGARARRRVSAQLAFGCSRCLVLQTLTSLTPPKEESLTAGTRFGRDLAGCAAGGNRHRATRAPAGHLCPQRRRAARGTLACSLSAEPRPAGLCWTDFSFSTSS